MKVCPICRTQFATGSNFCPYDGQRLEELDVDAPNHDRFVGKVLDHRYKIESKLGSGGMGDVYAARHVVIDKPVAIKILREEYSKDPRQAERFIREARAASHIGHPNIIDVTDFGRLGNNQIYFVMEYLVGVTLGKELKDHGALSALRTLNLSIQICRALDAAHAKGIVHRDLKPENIFIVNPATQAPDEETDGRHKDTIKLLDFGIAKITWDDQGRRLTKVGSVFGTPQYMSPEQASGKDTDRRGDIYSLGCIIYEMLTGEVPFLADTFMGTLTKQMFENPVPPRQLRPDLGIPEPVEQVILRAMSKDPEARYPTMKNLAKDLESCFETGESGEATQRAQVLVVQAGNANALEQITDGERETVHLLVPEKTAGDEAEPLPPPEPETVQPTTPDPDADLLVAPGAGSRLVFFVGVGLLFLVLTGGGIYLVLRSPDPPGPSPEGGDGPIARTRDPDAGLARVVPSEGPVEPVDANIRRVRLTLRSFPRGATIFEGGRPIGVAPHTVEVPAGVPKTYLFRLRGRRAHEWRTKAATNETYTARLPRRHGRRARDASIGSSPDVFGLRTPPELKRFDKGRR